MADDLHVRKHKDDLIAGLKQHGSATEGDPSFDALAAELRKLTKNRKQTPSERLLREAREER